MIELIGTARRGVLVAGRHERATPLGQSAARFCERAGWPLLADPMSGARRGDAAIAHYDALLREPGFSREHAPEIVLRVGDLPVSKPLRTWLAGLTDTPQIALDPEGAWQDPASVGVGLALGRAGGDTRCAGADVARPGDGKWTIKAPTRGPTTPSWLAGWRSADERAARRSSATLAESGLSEPSVAAELGVLLPEEATLFVASSMPVRDIETFWPARADPPRVLCNRGANGIDGTVSSALGAAAASRAPVVLLIGDVALAYDISALLAARRLDLKLTIVLLNNEGGGIFDFLPVARHRHGARSLSAEAVDSSGRRPDIYTRHIATPTGLDFAKAAALYGSGPRDRHGCQRLARGARAGARGELARRSSKCAPSEMRTWSCIDACGAP